VPQEVGRRPAICGKGTQRCCHKEGGSEKRESSVHDKKGEVNDERKERVIITILALPVNVKYNYINIIIGLRVMLTI
jgi:hypothetical protein